MVVSNRTAPPRRVLTIYVYPENEYDQTLDICEDAFAGLSALAECRHDEAVGHATKAQQSENPNYALAGLWLQVLTYADQKDEARARSLFPELVETDWDIKTNAQAEETMRKTLSDLMDIRQQYNLPHVCSD
jgi:hypothetical protein